MGGDGTTAHPYTIFTTVGAGNTGVTLTQIDTYVKGASFHETTMRVANSTAGAVPVTVWRAGDCFFQGSDEGYGTVARTTGAVGCRAGFTNTSGQDYPGLLILEFEPLQGDRRFYEAGYSQVWSKVGARAAFDDTCRCAEYIDNGAGLSWSFDVPATGNADVSHRLNVLDRPVQRGEIPRDADVDGIADASDNCVGLFNPRQDDSDGDGVGNVCEKPDVPRRPTEAMRSPNAIRIGWTQGNRTSRTSSSPMGSPSPTSTPRSTSRPSRSARPPVPTGRRSTGRTAVSPRIELGVLRPRRTTAPSAPTGPTPGPSTPSPDTGRRRPRTSGVRSRTGTASRSSGTTPGTTSRASSSPERRRTPTRSP